MQEFSRQIVMNITRIRQCATGVKVFLIVSIQVIHFGFGGLPMSKKTGTSEMFARGSEWRRWDLQVHTPFSVLNNEFGTDFEEYAKRLLEQAVENHIAAIGVTDYFSIAGYRHLRIILQDEERLQHLVGGDVAERAKKILFLPNVELRTSPLIADSSGTTSRLNFHVIFSNDIDEETIEEHFFREIKFTAMSSPGSPDASRSLTSANLIELGQRLKKEHERFRKENDLFVGMMNAIVAHEEVTRVLEGHSVFKDRYVIVVPPDEDLSVINWDGQGHLARKLVLQKAHMFFSSNEHTRDFALGYRHESVEQYLREFRTRKPCVHSSDAHGYDRLFKPDLERFTWIKANPTFQGLRSLLNEPEERVHIGSEPPAIGAVRNARTKFMSELALFRTEKAVQDQIWFDGRVPLNTGLIAVIGNKGSGKSALADILALLGHVPPNEDFSFLNARRFLAPEDQLGDMFRASVSWESGLTIEKGLNEQPDAGTTQLVKYIPQSYLEAICSEIKHQRYFQDELMAVIFSHVPGPDRLGKNSLREVLEFKSEAIQKRMGQLERALSDVNVAICKLEDKLLPAYRDALKSKHELKRRELEAHDQIEPVEVPKPDTVDDHKQSADKITSKIERIRSEKEVLQGRLETATSDQETAVSKVALAERLLERIRNFKTAYTTFLDESREEQEGLGVDVSAVVTLRVDLQPVHRAKAAAERERDKLGNVLDEKSEQSLIRRIGVLEKTEQNHRSELDEPNRLYQSYLVALQQWNETRRQLVGTSDTKDSLSWLEASLADLDAIPSTIAELSQKRTDLMKSIYDTQEELLQTHRDLYAPVQRFIDNAAITQQYPGVQIEAAIDAEGFIEDMLAMINQGRVGSFAGAREGRERLEDLVRSARFDSLDGVLRFVEQILDHLRHDKRTPEARPVTIDDQLLRNVSREQVYDFLFSLKYLRPTFELRWEGKSLGQLSPGERGIMLLIFYLLIDQDRIPLIIDQPEENLDNQTIAQVLVPAIKEARKRRQIVIVTHNPNLAVVCDADQVIHATMDKANGNQVTYESGALEEPAITQAIVDILEGTKPAFDHRDAKYAVLEQVQ